MEVNTVVYSYGLLRSRQAEIREGFNWYQILDQCRLFTRHERLALFLFNCGDSTAVIQPMEKRLLIHPRPNKHFLPNVAELLQTLEKAVGEYYKADCSIVLSDMSFIVCLYAADTEAHFGIRIGDRISVGSWPQGSRGEEKPIKWRVLDISEKEALLISEKGLIKSGYCDREKGYGNSWYLMWGNSLAREMCNGVFYHHLSDEVKKIIVPQEIDAVVCGPRCKDSVFLLSEGQVRLFLPKERDRIASPSEYLLADGVNTYEEYGRQNSSWWLLPYEDDYGIYPKAVEYDGSIRHHGRLGFYNFYMIRPCISVRLSDSLNRLTKGNAD